MVVSGANKSRDESVSTARVWVIALCLLGACWLPGSAFGQADAGTDVLPPGTASPDAGWTEAGRDCVRNLLTGSLHVLEPDAGPEELRQRAMEMCTKTGLPDVSTEESIQQVSEIVGDAIDEERENELLWEILITLGYLAAGLIPGYIFWRQMKNWSNEAEDLRDPAFDEEIPVEDLRENAELLEKIRGQIQFIGIQRLPSSSSGRYGGSSMQVNYSAFAVDTNGETHDISKSSDWAEVEKDAEWLAKELGVEVKDRTYG